MMKTTKTLKAVATTAILLALSACLAPDQYVLIPCPAVGVLADASEITRFRHGGGRDITDMTYHGEITSVEFSCRQPEGKDVVIGEAVIVATFRRGVAATSDRQFFNLFSVMSEREDRIVDKTLLSMDVKFKSGEQVVTARKKIKGIKVPTNGTLAPELYNVYFGFQLTPAEVAFNRTRERP